MSETVVLIGNNGAYLPRWDSMKPQLNNTVAKVDGDIMITVEGDVCLTVEFSLPECLKEPAEICPISRRNKSDRKRNRAERWR
ncbi:hypothetical protein [Shewanella sp. Shew256]|uniref:hypothetical protein n=1 Tax=Shewanella sp. Shew256 TaxID=1969376 RepID=UPI000B4A4989|nr:hypothetical protein [Shewanella sp. Shew256]